MFESRFTASPAAFRLLEERIPPAPPPCTLLPTHNLETCCIFCSYVQQNKLWFAFQLPSSDSLLTHAAWPPTLRRLASPLCSRVSAAPPVDETEPRLLMHVQFSDILVIFFKKKQKQKKFLRAT